MKTWLIAFLASGAAWYALAAPARAPSTVPARIDIAWTASNAFGTYHLQGRFVIRGLNDGSTTRVSNQSQPSISHSEIEVQPGVYSLTLEEGFQLARVSNAVAEAPAADQGQGGGQQPVASEVLSSNPLIVVAQAGRVSPMRLSLVARPEPARGDTPCIN